MLDEDKKENLEKQSNNKRSIDSIFILKNKKEDNFTPNKKIINFDFSKSQDNFLRTVPNFDQVFIKKKSFSKITFFLISIVFIFAFSITPIKILNTTRILKAKAETNIDRFESAYLAIQKNNFESAKENLLLIQKDTQYIKEQLNKLGQKNIFLSKFFPIKDTTINNENILDLVLSFSKIGISLIDDVSNFANTNIANVNNNQKNELLFENIKNLNRNLKNSQEEFENFKNSLLLIDIQKLNDNEKIYLSALEKKIEEVDKYYYIMIDATEQLPNILGQNFDKKYLLLFQNNTELRPTGGFIGTYGILTLRDAKIKKIFIDSIYNPDGQISKNILPPPPLQKITSSLAMRDANWEPHFPESAKNISDLYELEGGFTPDGIISFDTKPFIDLLEITGPVKLEKYNIEINKDNFIAETQYKTSIDYNPADQNPKKFLGDFAPLFLEKIFSSTNQNQGEILKILIKNIVEKHIQFFSPNEKIEKIFSASNATGEIKKTEGDYFYYIDANIGGMKTNQEIIEDLSHNIEIESDGTIIHNVEIKRKHNGSYNWPSGINYSYSRFYIPLGSKIISLENFEKGSSIQKDQKSGMLFLEENSQKAEISDLDISTAHNKTVAGIWQTIKPGEEKISKISYELPFKINISKLAEKYTLLIQKQSGVISQNTKIQIEAPQNYNIESVFPSSRYIKKNYFKDSFNLISDQQVGIILRK